MVALENGIVQRKIFSFLPLSDLKNCRLVKQSWNSEAVSFIRDFRPCYARISRDSPCADLLALAEFVSGMKIVPINSLAIEDCWRQPNHAEFNSIENQANILDNLLEKLPLKHLYILWATGFNPSRLVGNFVIDLLRRKITELRTLAFRGFSEGFVTNFGQAWPPCLPKLKVLDIGRYEDLNYKKGFFLKIIKAAPNLNKIEGRVLDSATLEFIPEDKYSCLQNMRLSIHSERERTLFSKLALAAPEMTSLYLTAPRTESERQFMGSYIHIVETIFSSCCKSLKTFTMASPIFPLDLLSFPPLINLQQISLCTENTTPHLLHVLRSINYPKLLPALYHVEVNPDVYVNPQNRTPNPWENNEAAQVVQVYPSTTVKHLDTWANFNSLTLKQLSEVFPKVAYLKARIVRFLRDRASSASLFSGLWEGWQCLESVSLCYIREALRWNFDAEFLGISSEEVDILRQLDDESLEKINIVPIRPSVLTLPRKVQCYEGLFFLII